MYTAQKNTSKFSKGKSEQPLAIHKGQDKLWLKKIVQHCSFFPSLNQVNLKKYILLKG